MTASSSIITPPRTTLRSLLYAVTFTLLCVIGMPLNAQEQPQESTIGGRFMLEDHNGQIVKDDDFQGRFMMITFGYTYCPDVCPTNLINMSEALETLGDKADQVVPLFVTVDPARDTAKRLRDYVKNFDKRIIGLTGPQAMIDNINKRYKIVSDIHRPEGWTDGDYTVDHTASIFLMSPDGEFLVKFAHGMAPDDMAKRIQDFM